MSHQLVLHAHMPVVVIPPEQQKVAAGSQAASQLRERRCAVGQTTPALAATLPTIRYRGDRQDTDSTQRSQRTRVVRF